MTHEKHIFAGSRSRIFCERSFLNGNNVSAIMLSIDMDDAKSFELIFCDNKKVLCLSLPSKEAKGCLRTIETGLILFKKSIESLAFDPKRRVSTSNDFLKITGRACISAVKRWNITLQFGDDVFNDVSFPFVLDTEALHFINTCLLILKNGMAFITANEEE